MILFQILSTSTETKLQTILNTVKAFLTFQEQELLEDQISSLKKGTSG